MRTNLPRYQVLTGQISHLRTEATHVNYLDSLRQAQQPEIGSAADEADPVNDFTMEVAGKPVCGSFWKTTFKNGDHVQVIGQQANGMFHAIAVVKPEERMLWMQPHCERGTHAKRKSLMKACAWFVLFMLVGTALVVRHEDMPLWFACINFAVITAGLLFFTVGMSWPDFMGFARKMDAVGEALGWPEPASIDLFKSTRQARKRGKPELPMGVYYY